MGATRYLLLSPIVFLGQHILGQSVDPFAQFNSDQKICTPVRRVVDKSPQTVQHEVYAWCYSFVGTLTTTVVGETVSWKTQTIPLKTVTVSPTPQPRYRRDEEEVSHAFSSPTPTLLNLRSSATALSAVTPGPKLSPLVEYHQDLKRAKQRTPSLFTNLASKAIRTGCACLGISTQITMPIFTTTTATRTVPASCAQAPYSAYHLSSYAPASASQVAYDTEMLHWVSDLEGISAQAACCQDCYYSRGCVQFTFELVEFGGEPVAHCVFRILDDYDGQNVFGIPAATADQGVCPRGYLGIEGLAQDTASSTASTATYLGPCAVVTTSA